MLAAFLCTYRKGSPDVRPLSPKHFSTPKLSAQKASPGAFLPAQSCRDAHHTGIRFTLYCTCTHAHAHTVFHEYRSYVTTPKSLYDSINCYVTVHTTLSRSSSPIIHPATFIAIFSVSFQTLRKALLALCNYV